MGMSAPSLIGVSASGGMGGQGASSPGSPGTVGAVKVIGGTVGNSAHRKWTVSSVGRRRRDCQVGGEVSGAVVEVPIEEYRRPRSWLHGDGTGAPDLETAREVGDEGVDGHGRGFRPGIGQVADPDVEVGRLCVPIQSCNLCSFAPLREISA